MESENQCNSTMRRTLEVVGTSPLVPVFLSLTFFTKNIRLEYYAYGILASGILLGLSLYIIGLISEKSSERLRSLGNLSSGFSRFLSQTIDVIVILSKYMTLMIVVDVFINVLFICFPFLDEVRRSVVIYRILFGLGMALIGLTLYVFSTSCRSVFLILSASTTLLFTLALVGGYALGFNEILPKPTSSSGSSLPSFFWITAVAFYTMEFISGGVKVIGKSRNQQSNSRVAIASALIVSGIYLVLLYSAGWIRSASNSLDIIKLIFTRSSKLNYYLRTGSIDKYRISSKLMCVCIPIICIGVFVTQFDTFIESFKNLVSTESDNKAWMLSLLVLGMIFIQVLFSEFVGGFNFYLMLLVIGITPLLAYYPFICHVFSSKKVTFFTAICVLAVIFICGVFVGTIRILMDFIQK